MRKGVFFAIALLFSIIDLHSQDPQFNNTQHSLVYLNPSFSGSNGYIRNQTEYRNQWPNLSGTETYYNTTFDGFIKPINGGISFSAFSDNVARGLIRQNKFSLGYAQYFKQGNGPEMFIVPSVQLSYGLNTLQTSRMTFPSSGYPQYGLPNTWTVLPQGQVHYFDMAAGILLTDKYQCWGISLSNLLQPNISFAGVYKVPVRLVVHGSINGAFSMKAKYNLLVAYVGQNNNSNVSIRVINTFDNFLLWGAGYRVYMDINPTLREVLTGYNNVSFYLGLRKNAFTVCYSYDFNAAKLYGNTAGSHELSLSTSLSRKNEQRKLVKLENR